MIEKRKNNAYREKVNEEMILLYLEVGKFLYELEENANYGDKITTKFNKKEIDELFEVKILGVIH